MDWRRELVAGLVGSCRLRIELPVPTAADGNLGQTVALRRRTAGEQQLAQILKQHAFVAEVQMSEHGIVDVGRVDGVNAVFDEGLRVRARARALISISMLSGPCPSPTRKACTARNSGRILWRTRQRCAVDVWRSEHHLVQLRCCIQRRRQHVLIECPCQQAAPHTVRNEVQAFRPSLERRSAMSSARRNMEDLLTSPSW